SLFVRCHVAPPSSERNTPPESASMFAQIRFELPPDTVIPMFPQIPSGRPGLRVSSVQWSPPSVVLNKPLPLPPDDKSQGVRPACQNPAYNTFGLPGSITRSTTPVESLRKKIFSHVLPPSFDRNTPRSGFGAQT